MAALSGKAIAGLARKRQKARGSGFRQGSVNGLPSLIDQTDDLALLRETVQLLFGEDERAVIGHLEHAAAGRLQRQVGDLASVGADKLFRQTDGVRQVVSDDAELNGDIHVMPPAIKCCIYSSMELLSAAEKHNLAADRPTSAQAASGRQVTPFEDDQPRDHAGHAQAAE
jgi:hypothetical protein